MAQPSIRTAPTPAEPSHSVIDWRAKGFPALDRPISRDEVRGLGWNLFDGRAMLPTLVLRLARLEHNAALMANVARERGLSLAPHGKTTMAPDIWQLQLRAGAWGITVATPWQARIAAMVGVPRIVLANEIVDPAGIAWLGTTLDDAGPEVWCWVDSIAGIELLETGLGTRATRLPVCVEVGMPGGRAGVRTLDAGHAIAERVAASPALRLGGVAFFEGVAQGQTHQARLPAVRGIVALARSLATALDGLVAADGGEELVLTGGGSQFLDVVLDALAAPLDTRLPTHAVLRSGGSVTHDHGGTDLESPFGSVQAGDGPRLLPALEVWAPVLSVPEPGRAIMGAGRRDLPPDGLPPMVVGARDRTGRPRAWDPALVRTQRLNDQHAFLELGSGASLQVGDLVALGVHHPCTAFDRWRWVAVVDERYEVIDAFETLF